MVYLLKIVIVYSYVSLPEGYPTPASPPLHRHHAAAWAMHETPRSAESTGMWCANGAVATSKTLEMNQEKAASSGKKLLKMIWFNNNLDFRCNKEWIRFKQQKRDWICQSSNWNLTSKASFLMSSTSHSGRKKNWECVPTTRTIKYIQIWWTPTILQKWGSKWPKLRPKIGG